MMARSKMLAVEEIDKEGNVLIQDNSIILMPKLFEVYKHKRMGSDMVRWIVCIADYKSPYRRLPEQERIRTVTYNIFSKYKHRILSYVGYTNNNDNIREFPGDLYINSNIIEGYNK